MKKLLLVSSLILSLITAAKAANVTAAWDPSCSTNILSYKLYYGPTNGVPASTNITVPITDDCGNFRPSVTNVYYGSYTNFVLALGRTNNTATITNLPVGFTVALAVVSYGSVPPSTNNVESDFSREILYTIPATNSIYVPPAITGFKIISTP